MVVKGILALKISTGGYTNIDYLVLSLDLQIDALERLDYVRPAFNKRGIWGNPPGVHEEKERFLATFYPKIRPCILLRIERSYGAYSVI